MRLYPEFDAPVVRDEERGFTVSHQYLLNDVKRKVMSGALFRNRPFDEQLIKTLNTKKIRRRMSQGKPRAFKAANMEAAPGRQ